MKKDVVSNELRATFRRISASSDGQELLKYLDVELGRAREAAVWEEDQQKRTEARAKARVFEVLTNTLRADIN